MMNGYNARPRAGARAVTLAGDVVAVRRREASSDLCAFDLTPGVPSGSDDPLRPHARVLVVRGAVAHLPVGVVVVRGVLVDDLLPGAVAADHHSYVVPGAVAAPVVTGEVEPTQALRLSLIHI